jgi:hypothetical protein
MLEVVDLAAFLVRTVPKVAAHLGEQLAGRDSERPSVAP